MRAFGWLSAISLALAACAAPPPPQGDGAARRVVSLNLCTDELVLLLADPGQLASLSHLSRREAETPLWRQAARFPANDGSLAGAAALRPDLVLTMGGAGDRARIVERIGATLVDLPFPQSIEDIEAAIRTVARALGHEDRGERLVARIATLRASAPAAPVDALWIGGGGRTVAPTGLEAQWMRLAGLAQRDIGRDTIQLEDLIASPPAVLLRTDYRAGQYSRQQAWLAHPLAATPRGSRTLMADGRRWTCLGPLLIDEIERLRQELRA